MDRSMGTQRSGPHAALGRIQSAEMKKSHLTLFVFFCAALASLLASGETGTLTASTERLQQHITELSKFGANPVSRRLLTTRAACNSEERRALLQLRMKHVDTGI